MKRKSVLKRILAFVTAAATVLTAMPATTITALAEEDTEENAAESIAVNVIPQDDYDEEWNISFDTNDTYRFNDSDMYLSVSSSQAGGTVADYVDAKYSVNASFNVSNLKSESDVYICSLGIEISGTDSETSDSLSDRIYLTADDGQDGIGTALQNGENYSVTGTLPDYTANGRSLSDVMEWKVTGVFVGFATPDDDATFTVRSYGYSLFTENGEAYEFLSDDNGTTPFELYFGDDGKDDSGLYFIRNIPQTFSEDSTLTLGEFASTYSAIAFDAVIPDYDTAGKKFIANVGIEFENGDSAQWITCEYDSDEYVLSENTELTLSLADMAYFSQYSDERIITVSVEIWSNTDGSITLYEEGTETVKFDGSAVFDITEGCDEEQKIGGEDGLEYWETTVNEKDTHACNVNYYYNYYYDDSQGKYIDERPLLAEFAGMYSSVSASFIVSGLDSTESVTPHFIDVKLVKENDEDTEDDDVWQDILIYADDAQFVNGSKAFTNGATNTYSATIPDYYTTDPTEWKVAGVDFEFISEDEADFTITPRGAFNPFEMNDYSEVVNFMDSWTETDDEGNISYRVIEGEWFNDETLTLADFIGRYNSVDAKAIVSDIDDGSWAYAATVQIGYKETASSDDIINTDIPIDAGDIYLDENSWKVSINDVEYDSAYLGYIIDHVGVIFASEKSDDSFILTSLNRGFNGEETYELYGDDLCESREFKTNWADSYVEEGEEGEESETVYTAYYQNPGNYGVSDDSKITLEAFAERYDKVLIEAQIPELKDGYTLKVTEINFDLWYDNGNGDDTGDGLTISYPIKFTLDNSQVSFTVDLSELSYEAKYKDYKVTGINFLVVSTQAGTIHLYNKDALVNPEKGTIYYTNSWDYDSNTLPEFPALYEKVTVEAGEGLGVGLVYINDAGEYVSIPLSFNGSSYNSNLKIYYQASKEDEKEVCRTSINYYEYTLKCDPYIWADAPYGIGDYNFSRAGIYTIEVVNDKAEYSGSVTINVYEPDFGFYYSGYDQDEDGEISEEEGDGHLMTNQDYYTRKTGDSITLVPKDSTAKYSILILDDCGYGSEGYCEDRKYFTVTDPEGNDVTDKVHYTNFAELTGDIIADDYDYEDIIGFEGLETFTGNLKFTLTDYAHRSSGIFVIYKDESGITRYRLYEWNESEESQNNNPRQLEVQDIAGIDDPLIQQGFTGYILNEAEYHSQGIDFWSGDPETWVTGSSMKEVIDKITKYIKDGVSTNYGYIWLEKSYVVNDPVSCENAMAEQYLSSSLDDDADIKGIIIRTDACGYVQYFSFDSEMKDEIDTLRGLDISTNEDEEIVIEYYDFYDEYEVTEKIDLEVLRAVNINADDDDEYPDCIYVVPANAAYTAFYQVEWDEDKEEYVFVQDVDSEGNKYLTPLAYEAHEETDSGSRTFKVGDDESGYEFYKEPTNIGIPVTFPKLHVDATNEIFLLGNFAEVADDEANIFMNLAPGTTTVINGESYTLNDDGTVVGTTRQGKKFYVNEGEIRSNTSSFYHWALGQIDYSYSVLVDKLEFKSELDVSEDSAVSGALVDLDISSMYDQITDDNGDMSETDRANLEGGNNLTLEAEISELEEGRDLAALEAEAAKNNAESTEYIDILLEYYVGYDDDAVKTAITETDEEITLSIVLSGDQYKDENGDYDADAGHYTIARDHEGRIEYITPQYVEIAYECDEDTDEDIAAGVIVTFVSKKFSAYAIMFGACVSGHDDFNNDGLCDECGLPVCLSVGLNYDGVTDLVFRYTFPDSFIAENNEAVAAGDGSDWKMVFTFNGKTKEIPLADIVAVVDGGVTCYDFRYEVSAKEMGDTIQADFTNGEEHSTISGSVKQYCNFVMTEMIEDNYVYSDALRNFANALLQYGAACQEYFGYETENLVNANLEALDSEEFTEDYTPVLEDSESDGVTYYGSSLMLENGTKMRFYFELESDVSGYIFEIDGEVVTPVAAGNLYYIESDLYTVDLLGEAAVITVISSSYEDDFELTQSVLSYVQSGLAGSNAKLKKVCGCLWDIYNCGMAVSEE